MNKYKAYPSYKDSGIEWLGDVPEGWDSSKLKYHALVFNGNSIGDNEKSQYENLSKDSTIPYISTKDIDAITLVANYCNGMRVPKNTIFKVAKKDSTLICIEGGSAGKKISKLSEDSGFVNKLACIDSYNGLSNNFNHYLVRSTIFNYSFSLATTGLIPGVAINQLKDFEIIIPPLTEQQAIADFLDKKTAQIDTLVDKAKQSYRATQREKNSSYKCCRNW